MDHQVLPFPSERAIVIDAGRLASRRHVVHALIEVDVTRARELLGASSAQLGGNLSFTAFVVASLARAIESDPLMHASRDWRGRLVVFSEVDIVTMIESGAGSVAKTEGTDRKRLDSLPGCPRGRRRSTGPLRPAFPALSITYKQVVTAVTTSRDPGHSPFLTEPL